MSDTGPNDPWWPGTEDPDPSTWWENPAFTVRRKADGGRGDYVRGSSVDGLPQTALRYGTTSETEELIPGKGVLYTRPEDYHTIKIQWNIPMEVRDSWQEVSIVRSGFGYPSTVNDGQTIYRTLKSALYPEGYPKNTAGEDVIPTQTVYDPRDPYATGTIDPGLQGGRWYYYSLFFRTLKRWVRSMVACSLLPRNFGHSEHLWNNIPPYYRWIDEQQIATVNEGDLRRFLRIFGYELDYTREFVESWQTLYDIDRCPGPLLRHLGENVGVSEESKGIGDIRMRSLMARIGYLYRSRGTTACLEQVVEAVTKCACDITPSANTMVLPDDSDFFTGTGNWAGLHPLTPAWKVLATVNDPNPSPTILAPSKIFLEEGVSATVTPPPGYGRGVMRMWTSAADATTDVILTCGDGLKYSYPKDSDGNYDYTEPPTAKALYPRYTGIPVEANSIYGFSIWVKGPAGVLIDVILTWFNDIGNPEGVVQRTQRMSNPPGPVALATTNVWQLYSVQGAAPTHNVVENSVTSPLVRATPQDSLLNWRFEALNRARPVADYDWVLTDTGPVANTYETETTFAAPGTKTATLTVAAGAGPPAGGSYAVNVAAYDAEPGPAVYCVPTIYIDNRPAAAGGATTSPVIQFGGGSFPWLGVRETVTAEIPNRYFQMNIKPIGEPRETPTPYEGYLMGEPP